MAFDGVAFGRDMAGIVKGVVEAATVPLIKRVEELEARQPEKGEMGPQGDTGPRGDAGADAYAGRARGLWDIDADYRARDVVALNGSSFMAKHDEPGECPGEGWMLVAQKGKRGDRGASFSAGVFDKDTNELVLQRDDGEEVTINLAALVEAARNA